MTSLMPNLLRHRFWTLDYSAIPRTKNMAMGIHQSFMPKITFVLYDLRHPKVPNRAVEVDNQFGKGQRLKVVQAVGLFVPTMTVYTSDNGTLGFAPTAELDHFKCYEVKGENVKQKVSVSDEFVPEMSAAGVYAPDMLCNPVVKIHPIDSTTVTRTDIQNSDDHLETRTETPILPKPSFS